MQPGGHAQVAKQIDSQGVVDKLLGHEAKLKKHQVDVINKIIDPAAAEIIHIALTGLGKSVDFMLLALVILHFPSSPASVF